MGEKNSTNIDVSIIIVNANTDKNILKECLVSIFKYSKLISIEVILIDNNTTAYSIEDLINNINPNIKLIKNSENKGFGAANNQGIKIAKGKYILFLNNDTKLFENSIYTVYKFAESKNENVIVGCKLLNRDESLQLSTFDFPNLINTLTANLFLYLLFPTKKRFNKYHFLNSGRLEISEVDVVTGAFMFCSAQLIKNIGGFDERFYFYGEEIDLCKRAKDNGGKVYYYPNTSIFHYKGSTTQLNIDFKFTRYHIAQIQYLQKHFRGIKFYTVLFIHYFGLFIRIPLFFLVGIITLNKDFVIRSKYSLKNLFVYPKNIFKV